MQWVVRIFIVILQLSISRAKMNEGEFSIKFRECGPCNSSMSGTQEIQWNICVKRISKNETKIFGNITNAIPLDDNLRIDTHFWRFHNERGFQKIPWTFAFQRACSEAQVFWGKEWGTMFKDRNNKCPIPPGVHIFNGLSIEQLMKQKTWFLPTQLMYGRYKFAGFYVNKRNNKVVGCSYAIADFKPDFNKIV